MIPRATYRLQFNKDFGFDDACRIASYLARLGVSHVYASPWLKARPDSTHGYDIVDHHSLNPELGGEAGFGAMVAALKSNSLGQILDFVPNHMGVGGADNPLWLDVLEWGRDSAYSGWFDIDWDPESPYLQGKLLAPCLGNQYGVALENGKLTLKFDEQEGSFAVWAYDTHKLPICPVYYQCILGDSHPELERVGDAFAGLPEWRPQVARRAHDLKLELAQIAREREDVREAIAIAVVHTNSNVKKFDALIQKQHWRAAYFRVAADDINYRRFFNINDLAGLRIELPEVFEYAHAVVLKLLADGTLDGLRIDHVDGLLNPKEYLERLRAAVPKSYYLVVEKILAYHEGLSEDWPVEGTTGYVFANQVLGLLIDPAGEEPFTRLYAEFTGWNGGFADIVRDCKMRIMRYEMASELNVVARDAARVAHQHPKTMDFTHNVLRRAIREVIASFPVYRTYLDWQGTPSADDTRDLTWAIKRAKANEQDMDPSVFDFVCKLLSGELVSEPRSGYSRHSVLRCAMRIQQYSGPVMAKGLEDTTFYRYNRFIALNEVGGYPERFGISIANFHKANTQRWKRWPNTMVATSTHDTKRGEDTRARLAVLSEMPEEWAKQTRLWSRIIRARRADIEASGPPDRNDEYLFYQTLVGSWPLEMPSLDEYKMRLKGAMTKAMREAKVHTTWAAPNTAYEDAVLGFIDAALDLEASRSFFDAFLPFIEHVGRLGMQNSLVQTTLKLTVPGLPDLYQGTELWDFSLVDPDNRRPVDYARRIELLDQLGPNPPWNDGSAKLFVTCRLLQLRAARPELFEKGDYEPLIATGDRADCVCAFGRRYENQCVTVAVARFPARRDADPDWRGTRIPLPWSPRNIFTGAECPVENGCADAKAVFEHWPVAVFANCPL